MPLILNYRLQFEWSRWAFITYQFFTIVFFSVVFSRESHFQYYAFISIALSLLVIKPTTQLSRWVFPLIGFLCWCFLEWYHNYHPAFVNLSYSMLYAMRVGNDFIIIVVNVIIYYTMVKEQDADIQKIKQKSLELEEKNTQLEHFAYIASHDLNEPLRTIHSFVDIIKEEQTDDSNEDIQTYLNFIQEALDRMRSMIDGLLNYARIGKSGDFQTIDVHHLLAELQQDLDRLIRAKEATITSTALPTVYGSRLELRQLFQNLITNAIKFQQPNHPPVVTISGVERDDYWEFCVSDNGIGIRPEKHQEIFSVFTKLHRNTEYEGQGIGLSFCKKIVELHQGMIWVESALGQGSQFYFTIAKNRAL